jgi:uncharacterized membrane protein YozB (DUF420 family)
LNFYESLPTLNAFLNGTAAILLFLGYLLIRNGRRQAHKRVMISAFAVSTVFLASYLLHHYHAGLVYFKGTGAIKAAYLLILTTHTILAVTVPVLAIITLNRGLAGKYDKHRTIAKWTFPVWMYVSVTGVVVYLMLYHL